MCSLVFFGSHFHSVLNQWWSSALKYNLPAYSGLHIWQKDRGRCNAYQQTRFGRDALGKRRIQSLVIGIAMTGSLVEVSSWSVLVHPLKNYIHIIPNPLSSKLIKVVNWKGMERVQSRIETAAISSSHSWMLPGHLAARSCPDWIWLTRLWDGEVLLT